MIPDPQSTFFSKFGARLLQPAKDRTEPQLWFCELRLLRRWAPGDEALIRSFTLRRGLNILWAEPEDPVANHEMYGDGLAGHATGKTLFCRILRHLLGEEPYGTKDLRDGIEKEFIELWAVAHVRLAEESWIVGRNMTGPRGDFAVKGSDINVLLKAEPPTSGFDTFVQHLLEKICGPVSSLHGNESWRHLLPWLTRDQEARFANLVSWRDAESEGDNPRGKVSEQHLLMRALLGIFDSKESELRAELEQLVSVIETDTARKPEVQRQFEREERRLFPLLADLNLELTGFETLEALVSHLESAAEVRDSRVLQIKQQPESDVVRVAREAWEAARISLTEVSTEVRALKAETEHLETTRNEQLLNIHKIRTDGIGDASRISSGFCPNGIQEAQRRGCVKLNDTPQFEVAELQRQADELGQHIQLKKTRLGQLESSVERLEADIVTKGNAFRKVAAESQAGIVQIVRELGQIKSLTQRVRDVIDAKKGLTEIERRLGKVGPKQDALRKKLIALRDEQLDRINQLSDIFGDIVRAVMGASVRASLKVTDAGMLQTYAERNGVLRGAALETIKTLAFDLAGVVASMEGRGDHPRFLVHDGPREADMARVIYERFFLYAEHMEKACGPQAEPNFQYILTTTTHPPENMQRGSKWLLGDVLTSKSAEGRLLRRNL